MANENEAGRFARGGAADGERTVIGRGVTVTGNITCKGTIHIDGDVDGTVKANGVSVGRDGTLRGEVRTDKLHVAGTLEGDVDATDASLANTANVTAQLRVNGPLEVEEGARIEGDLRCSGSPGTAVPTASGVSATKDEGVDQKTAT